MSEPKDSRPSLSEQQEILARLHVKSIQEGENWYLIDKKWMQNLKDFLGDKMVGNVANPGPIDNSKLFDDTQKDIRKSLSELTDFDKVPEEEWNFLTKLYGLIEGQAPISRKAVKESPSSMESIVEIYRINLRCLKNFDEKQETEIQVSRTALIGDLNKLLKERFNIEKEVNTRILKVSSPATYTELDMKKTVQECSIQCDSHIVINTLNMDGTCYGDTVWKPNIKNATSSISTIRSMSSPILPQRSRIISTNYSKGVCGLINLGNTCFMNSVLQCLSNCPPITDYFLDNKHLQELNEENPLGMKGEIAKAYCELIKIMWSGKHPYYAPQSFKIQVGNFNPSFYGCQQHDSQELLTFLLDGLHEDLNRIKRKQYIAVKDDCGREDSVVAKETWDNYRKRNDSIIVDTFHGLLKSRVVCPDCERLSVTFDPFCCLSLPLPLKKDRQLSVLYIPYDDSKSESKYIVVVPTKGTIKDLCSEIGHQTSGNPDHMLVAEITNCHFHKFFSNSESLDSIQDKDVIYVYQLNMDPNSLDQNWMIFPVCFWEASDDESFTKKHIFGVPYVVVCRRQSVPVSTFCNLILDKMKRHFTLGALKNIENGDHVSETSQEQNYPFYNNSFKFYVIDTTDYTNPDRIIPVDGVYNLPDLLFGNKGVHGFGRLTILLQFTREQKKEFYKGKPAELSSHSTTFSRERSKINMEDCLRLFTTCEKLSADDAWYCPSCKKHQRATKKFDLWKLPKVLIIHLKRFSYTRSSRDKIETFVDVPLTDLIMTEYIINKDGPAVSYDLVGICNHCGNMGAGHYTAFCKNKIDGKWYSFDDETVKPLSEDELVTSAAYVLFYMAKPCATAMIFNEDCMDIN